MMRESALLLTLMASSASMEQCNLTGGRFKCLAMSVFLSADASSIVFPCNSTVSEFEYKRQLHRRAEQTLIHSVARLLLAIAEPHLKNEYH